MTKSFHDTWTGTPPAGTERITFERHPGDAEAQAAIAAMPDHTPSPRVQLPAIGDFVSGTTTGKRWSGRVLEIERNRMVVEADGAWLVVHPQDITH